MELVQRKKNFQRDVALEGHLHRAGLDAAAAAEAAAAAVDDVGGMMLQFLVVASSFVEACFDVYRWR